MLSTIGRAAVRRVVAGGPRSTKRAFYSIWQIQRVAIPKYAASVIGRSDVQRSYATTTATATKPKPKSRASPTKKAKTATAPAKKAPKKPVKKAAPKKKAALKKKPVKKPIKARKPLSDRQKLMKEKKKLADHRATLKVQALLTAPVQKPKTSWLVYSNEHLQKGKSASDQIKALATEFKNLSPAELEKLNHTANQNKATNQIAYKQWVESHTPDQIRAANTARLALKKLSKTKGLGLPPIIDDRLPKRPVSAYLHFVQSRYNSGDFKGIAFTDAARLIIKEFKALPASESKHFTDLASSDRQRYEQEIQTVYLEPRRRRGRKA